MIIPFNKSASKMAPCSKDSKCVYDITDDSKLHTWMTTGRRRRRQRVVFLFLSSVVSVVVVSSTFDDTLSLSFSARERTPIIYINKVFTFRERKSLDPKPPGNVEYSRLWPNKVPRDGPRACRTQPRHRSSPHFVYVSIDDGVSTNR